MKRFIERKIRPGKTVLQDTGLQETANGILSKQAGAALKKALTDSRTANGKDADGKTVFKRDVRTTVLGVPSKYANAYTAAEKLAWKRGFLDGLDGKPQSVFYSYTAGNASHLCKQLYKSGHKAGTNYKTRGGRVALVLCK